MTTQTLVGTFGVTSGIFVTKPGFDVFTARPGQFLIDPNSTIYQIVATGLTQLPSDISSGSIGISLGSAFSPYSNLFLWGTWYELEDGSPIFTPDLGNQVSMSVLGGTLVINYSIATATVAQYFARWIIFRNSY